METGRPFKVFNHVFESGFQPDGTGNPIAVNIKIFPLKNDEDQIVGGMILFEDVTERKRIEDRFFNVFENANDAIFILDEGGNFTYLNRRGIERSGYTKSDIIGKFFSDIVAPDSLDHVENAFQQLIQGSEVRNLNCNIISKDGHKIVLEINASPVFMDGEVTAIQGIARDITEKLESEEEIRRMKELNEGIVAGIPSAIAVINKDLNIEIVNYAFCNYFRTTEDDAVGKSIVDFLPPDFFKEGRIETKIDEVLSSLSSSEVYKERGVRFKQPKGEVILDIFMVPTKDELGRAVVILEDITERTKLEEVRRDSIRLQSEYEKLKEIDEMKSEFINVASHELRTPLTGLRIYIDRLQRGHFGKITKSHKEKLERVWEQTEALMNIIEKMLDTARIVDPSRRMWREKFDLRKMTDVCVKRIKVLFDRKDQKVEIDIGKDVPAIYGDPDYIERVIMNLLTNAWNYSPRGGVINIDMMKTNGEVLVRVLDNGPGVPDEHKEKVFKRFYVVDKTLTRKGGGVGLGLSIAKAAVESHGGRIWVEDNQPNGAIFCFILPIGQPEEEEETA
jgi:PAS domain S-box-containing protein